MMNEERYAATENCANRLSQAIINQKMKTNATKRKTRLKN